MKIHGEINLQQNNLRNAVIPLDISFPASPVPGQVVFKDRILYICAEINAGTPIWIPLTNQITSYTHLQSAQSATWNITHNLNTTHVIVTVYDLNNRVVMANEVEVNNSSSVTVSFAAAMAGKAVVLTGHFDGMAMPTYSYEHYQTNPSNTWIIPHMLGRNPIVRVFVGNQEIQPATITFDSLDQVTLTFNSPFVGQAKLI